MNVLKISWPLKFVRRLIIIPAVLLITSSANQESGKDNPDPDVKRELESFKVADGFEVTLFAAEPLVAKPIQMNWDADGRLWVVSSTAYPHLKTGEQANDKIFVLEDTDGDGKADKSTIFAEGLITPTGILPGDGGVYVANSTEILHFADTDGDGKADKKRRILNGFGTADTHHLIHTFRWGPEGLLYFNQSIYIYSHVETPSGIKRLEGGGVWQLNPKHLELDIYAKGLVNPWGLQFDRWGQSFLTDGAGFEGINYAFPGATFLTSPGAARILRGLNPGQPKHSGLDVISGRHLPESWQGSVITNDFRANRINRFKLEEQGSGYASKQAEDLLWTDHVAFRPVDINVGPDGAIYVADWYNPIIQHGEVDFHDPRRDHEHGRIWRIVAKNRPLVKKPQLTKASITELLDALKLPEDWTRLQAKQVLKARGAKEVIPALEKWVQNLDKKDAYYEHNLLEALWLYQTLEVVNESLLRQLLTAENHKARAAALRALELWYPKLSNVPPLLTKAVADKHPQVRLEAVIALRKVKTAEAARTALTVLDNPMDEFLDFALWQTVRELEPQWMARLKTDPTFLGNTNKTVFALKSVNNPTAVAQLAQLYQKDQVPEEYQKDVLSAIAKFGTAADLTIIFDKAIQDNSSQPKRVAAQLGALEDAARRNVKPTSNLNQIAGFVDNEDDGIATNAIRLIGLWKLDEQNGTLVNLAQKADKNRRKVALGALAALDTDQSRKALIDMTGAKNSPDLRLAATSQFVSVNTTEAARIGGDLLRTLPAQLDVSELFQAFLTNKQGAKALSEELSARKIPENRAKEGRQIMQRQVPYNRRNDESVKLLAQALEASGGVLPVEKMPQELTSQEISSLAKTVKETADPVKGELVFRKSALACLTCHAIGGAGGRIGPDLSSLGTSSPAETIIRSILYPNLSIKEGFELQRVVKKDGSELMGYLIGNGNAEVVIRDVSGGEVAIPKSQVGSIEKVPGSLMPSGLTASLDKEEFANLVGFLSKLGESGKFRVPTARFVRRWNTTSGSKELARKIGSDGLGYLVKDNTKITWQPAYSKVSGDLPLDELPILDANVGKRYSFVRFDIEVVSKGNVNLAMNSTAGVSVWVGQKPLKLTDRGVVADFAQGIHAITVAIDRTVQKEGSLNIQLLDAETSPAQTRLVIGR
ncbi:PVC-type heme-binding CxxCH protein [Spirosoma foliorum]|uniref:HEAT repeat domain-containing protein n=1 Tax=Spirosoma foliorum TaxID=2710596 RepID=A0A7G5GRU9_9BACT|nr:PVC-type heme-binding CxxCH protein [Spirosoma foliorum]QMW01591.1 HEAT repeat domain-containing protein [Spirosoma foliorum]